MKRIGLLSIALATAVTVACNGNARSDNAAANSANDPTAVGTAGEADRNTVSDADRNFVKDVSVANMAEIELGQLASQRGVSADVKQFGQMMVQDHTKAGTEFQQAVSQYNIPLPQALDETHQDLKMKLSKLQGLDFDKEYISAMVDGHEAVLDKLETRVDGHGVLGTDKDTNPVPEKSDNHVTMAINQWAAATLPTVRHHADTAKQIKQKLDHGRNSTN
jgi:putative membrane protein